VEELVDLLRRHLEVVALLDPLPERLLLVAHAMTPKTSRCTVTP
jgi:hypothetical protein